jgi:Flp pilus assembly pilin Flp
LAQDPSNGNWLPGTDAPETRTPDVNSISRFLHEDDGQDMVEYALLASFISIVAIVAIRAIGPLVRTIYQNIQAALT